MVNWFCSDRIATFYPFYCKIAILLTLPELQYIPRLIPWLHFWVGTDFFPKCHLLGFSVLLGTNVVAKWQYFHI